MRSTPAVDYPTMVLARVSVVPITGGQGHPRDLIAPLLVLRRQLAVLQRRTPRPQISWSDRAVLAALARLLPARRRRGLSVTPATIISAPPSRC